MLSGKGFKKVFNVSGGIKAWHSKTAIGPESLGIDLFDSIEEPFEVLKVAYSMEQGLREFYLTLGKETENERVKDLFSKLADIEVKHQMSIYIAYNNLSEKDVNKENFEKMVEKKALEGGLSTQEYLDLYQRVSKKVENKQSRDIINKIANEEKAHLASLGKLMDSL
jgi:rubrerythrin